MNKQPFLPIAVKNLPQVKSPAPDFKDRTKLMDRENFDTNKTNSLTQVQTAEGNWMVGVPTLFILK